MKLPLTRGNRRGASLAVVLVLCAVTLLILGSALSWVTTNTTLSQRNNEYFRTTAVAEAATEKVISRIMEDYKRGGDSLVIASVSTYRDEVPKSADNGKMAATYKFTDGQGGNNKVFVQNTAPTEYKLLNSQYSGLRGYTTPFRIIANAQQHDTLFKIISAVRQDIDVTTIPLFQFAIFYNLDLEIHPGPDMEITGRVHGNEDIYLQPGANLTFREDVTAAGTILDGKKPGDPLLRSGGTITFDGERDSGASSLNLPIGTDNSPAAVRQVVEAPPSGESPTSPLGSQRLYNKADMIVTIPPNATSPNHIIVTSGIINSKGTTVPQQQWDGAANLLGFLKLSSFYNPRESRTVTALDIDVGRLRLWSGKTTNILRPNLPAGDVRIIYVDDQRPKTALKEPGVRMVNGAILPTKGLTLATAAPIYVKGDYNTSDTSGHVSKDNDTTYARPAALIGDAITILSDAWTDALTLPALRSRKAKKTTVNAAFLAGIVETTPSGYSGGVENFPRFLEDWSGKDFTYNGSMVVMFPSRIATGAWGGTGDEFGIYNAPTRRWAFDTNFRDVTKLPPGTPVARKILRSVWKTMKPNTIAITGP